MRVLAFSDVALPEGDGGVERTLAEIYPRIVAPGATRVRLLTMAAPQAPPREVRDGVEIVRARRLDLGSVTGAQTALSWQMWQRASQSAREFRPDLLHAHTLFFHSSLVAAAVARRLRLPLLLTLHIGSTATLPQPHRFATQCYERTLGRVLLRVAQRIICVSDDVRRHALSLGAPPSKLTVIPNGVDLADYQPAPRPPRAVPVALCVGRLIFNKGQRFLLDATARLRDEGAPLRVRFAGDGPAASALRARTRALGLTDRVEFLGHQDNVAALLADADIFVRPSLTDGMSLAVLEALASGLPVVATDVSGTRELIGDGAAGIVVPPASTAELAQALQVLAQDPQRRLRMGARARERALAFDWASVAARTHREMTDVCA